MISVNPLQHPIFIDIREDSNSQHDFERFIISAIDSNYLQPGDYLIMDNATVHTAEDTIVGIAKTFREKNISVYLLPTYSPELSPIELIFNMVKSNIRYNRSPNTSLFDAIIEGLATVTREKVMSAYNHVIENFIQNPLNIPHNYELGC